MAMGKKINFRDLGMTIEPNTSSLVRIQPKLVL